MTHGHELRRVLPEGMGGPGGWGPRGKTGITVIPKSIKYIINKQRKKMVLFLSLETG